MRFKLLVFVITSAIFLSGCIPNLSNQTGPKQADEFLKGSVVKDFPQVPLHEKGKVIESYSKDNNHGAIAVVDEDLAKVVEFYQTGLDYYKWEYKLNQKSPTNYIFDVKNSEHEGNIYINLAADGKKVAVTIALAKR